MQNTIRYNYGGNILVDIRADQSASLALSDTSNIIEIKEYEYTPTVLSNTPDLFSFIPPHHSIASETFPSGTYNRNYIHTTTSAMPFFSQPDPKFTLAQPNSFFDYDLFFDNNLTFSIRISRY